jgi:YbgC/YbaW family acyl-CoA thioester hydrolase
MLDIAYAVRLIALLWKHKAKKVPKNLFCETVVHGRCWPNDLDMNWHMNNSRYLRECDFGRISLLIETGLWNAVGERRKNGMKDVNILVSALQVQYRQSVELGDQFEIRTRINGWDDKAFYLEQSMILEKNGEIAFLMLVRFALTPRSLTPQMLVDDLQIGSIQSPSLSPYMQNFKENYKLDFKDIKSKI